MIIPEHIHLQRPPHGNIEFGANLTPAFTVVEPHIDHFYDTIIDCHRSEKIIVMWAFSEQNQTVLEQCLGEKYAFARHVYRFCAPLVGIVDDKWFGHLPAGTIHSPTTFRGGVLTGLNWITVFNYTLAIKILDYELRIDIESNWKGLCQMFIDQLESLLTRNDPEVCGKVVSH